MFSVRKGRVMIAQAIAATILSISIVAGAAATEMVEFKGKGQEIVKGKLTKPEGKGPFPAMILLHGCLGWSQGAASTLAPFCSRLSAQGQKNPFRAAVAFYPYCYKPLVEMKLPLLVLVGDRDDYCPSALWWKKMPLREARGDMIVKVYPGA
jgi:dienelactone hydrolase